MILMLAAVLLGPLLALPFAWLLGLPLAAVSRGPGNARPRQHSSQPAPRSLGRDAGDACHLARLHHPVCGIGASQQQTTAQTSRRTTVDIRPPGTRRTRIAGNGSGGSSAPADGEKLASGSIATSVIVAADGANSRALPARGVDASTLAAVVDLGLNSGSLTDLKGRALAVSSSKARSFGWHIGDPVNVWLGDGTPAKLRVAATYTRPLGFGDSYCLGALIAPHVTQPLDEAVFVEAELAPTRPGSLPV